MQELAFTLAAGHEYLVRLTELGVPVEKAARSIRFSMAVTSILLRRRSGFMSSDD